ncbi:peptidoglycan DD-metalloendopeptidase family protein [Candidatus Oscillochloris fontis]|uniref:peptidoglycan DD-metalloendopeptidase family protein n=1 Tax=Candidatus Oscillochloris fontis TaxID=2496868 RepID=UPI00101DD8FD|nr:peptidoglycan DD-metalloendopeptidase family protein [Candidatus Oscillochloris fontis]
MWKQIFTLLLFIALLLPARPINAQTGSGFLGLPWPAGMRVIHLAYFDHVYPTVDSGDDGNSFVVTYLNHGNVQYNGHDGHDYVFPDQMVGTPILAAASGVAYARTQRGNGVVILHPNGYETIYWHLDDFGPQFAGLIDSGQSVAVQAGEVIGYSGSSGFVRGTPHLHFEVRLHGKQVDPYGWYGPGPDPCAEYAGCLASTWLWHDELRGSYDFTPPDAVAVPQPDTSPPIALLSLNPPADLLFAADFDRHPLQTVGAGFPAIIGELSYQPAVQGEALVINHAELTYPTSANLNPEVGTLSLWVEIPAEYPANRIERHYLIAASANPSSAPVYPGTMALRRDLLGPEGSPRWTFWTVGADVATSHELAVPDTLAPGWHHVAISWEARTGTKRLVIDGVVVAQAAGVALPSDVGPVLHVGRFSYGGAGAGVRIDGLRIYQRALSSSEIAALAAGTEESLSATWTNRPRIRLDTNAIDEAGGIVAVQIGVNGIFAEPQAYHDAYYVRLPPEEGAHTIEVRYTDRAGNTTSISQTIHLDLPPLLNLNLEPTGPLGTTVSILVEDGGTGGLMMQVTQQENFWEVPWQPLRERFFWAWNPELPQQLRVRVRDMGGNISTPGVGFVVQDRIYLPLVVR